MSARKRVFHKAPIALALSIAASSALSDEARLSYYSSGIVGETGSNAVLTLGSLSQDQVRWSNRKISGLYFSDPTTPLIDRFVFDLTGFTAYDNIRRASGELGALSFIFGNDVDASLDLAQDPIHLSTPYNDIEVIGNAATASDPRSRFTFVGTSSEIEPTNVDYVADIASLVLTNVDLVGSELAAGALPGLSNGCLFGTPCYSGDVTLRLGFGANHTSGYLELNNASISTEMRVQLGRTPYDVKIGEGDSQWYAERTSNIALDTLANRFDMVGQSGSLSTLTMYYQGGRLDNLSTADAATSVSIVYLGKSASLDYAHLILDSAGVSAPTDGVWNVNNSTIELQSRTTGTNFSTFRTGELTFSNSNLVLSGTNPWVYLGIQSSSMSGVTFSDSSIDATNSTGGFVQFSGPTTFSGNNVLQTASDTDVQFSGDVSVQSGTLSFDNIDAAYLSSSAGTDVNLLTGSARAENLFDWNIGGNLNGSGVITMTSSGASALSIDGEWNVNRYQYANGVVTQSNEIGEVSLLGGNLELSANAVLNFDLSKITLGGNDYINTDLINVFNADVVSLPNIYFNSVNPQGVITADDLDGTNVRVMTLYTDPFGFGTADFMQDMDAINVTLDSDLPALIDVAFIDDTSTHGTQGVVGGSSGNEVANLTAVFTKRPVQTLSQTPTVQTTNQVASANLLGAAALVHEQSSGGTGGTGVTGGVTTQPPITTPPQVPTDPLAAIYQGVTTVTQTQLPTQLNTLHPEPYASYITVGLESGLHVIDSVMNRGLAGHHNTRGAVANETGSGSIEWIDASGVSGDVEGSSDLGNYHYGIDNVTLGASFVVTDDAELGFFMSFGEYDLDEHDIAAQTLSSKTLSAGLYTRKYLGNWSVDGLLGYSHGSHRSSREVIFGQVTGDAYSRYNSASWLASTRVAYRFELASSFSLSPSLGLNYQHYRQSSFSERGEERLTMYVEEATAESWITSAGLTAEIGPWSAFKPLLMVRYEYDWSSGADNNHEIFAGLNANPGVSEGFVGQSRGSEAWVYGVGFASSPVAGFQMTGGVIWSDTENGEEIGGGLSASFAF